MQALSRLHPLGLTEDWSDKLQGQVFTSVNQRVTHEHYSQAYPPPPSTPYALPRPACPCATVAGYFIDLPRWQQGPSLRKTDGRGAVFCSCWTRLGSMSHCVRKQDQAQSFLSRLTFFYGVANSLKAPDDPCESGSIHIYLAALSHDVFYASSPAERFYSQRFAICCCSQVM